MTQITPFYRLEAPDSQGRTLQSYWSMTDDQMEHRHDFIQWMFPLRQPSAFNPDAPLLTDDDINAFHHDPAMTNALRRSSTRFLQFLGLESDGHTIRKAPNFHDRAPTCWNHPNHNFLRITRCLTSLRTLGLSHEAAALFTFLQSLHAQNRVDPNTFAYWQNAMNPTAP